MSASKVSSTVLVRGERPSTNTRRTVSWMCIVPQEAPRATRPHVSRMAVLRSLWSGAEGMITSRYVGRWEEQGVGERRMSETQSLDDKWPSFKRKVYFGAEWLWEWMEATAGERPLGRKWKLGQIVTQI